MSQTRDEGARRPPESDAPAVARRDFLQGVAVAVGAGAVGALPSLAEAALLASPGQPSSPALPGYYPPTRTGLRGSHPGAFEGAHALRDGRAPAPPQEDAEAYDLVVVGGGLSGLSAAWFWRQERPEARVLVLDNHDDFGGHAKRNEVHVDGRTLLINGGTMLIDSPRPYSETADGLLRALGVDPPALARADPQTGWEQAGLSEGTFFCREAFGRDQLVLSPRRRRRDGPADPEALRAMLASAPLSEAVRRDIVRIETGREDPLPGLGEAEKRERLSRMSYADYLVKVVKADPGVLPYYQDRTHGEWGVGIDAEPALDCWGLGLPGFEGLDLDRSDTARMGYTAAGYSSTGGSYRYHFPDGNASIARLLVRRLAPGSAPGSSAEDIVLAPLDYAALDRPGQAVRIRLSSVAVNVRNTPDGQVLVTYEPANGAGPTRSVRAGACVMAGYNMMIPYVVPDLPAEQKAALHQLVKVPLVYASVALRNWRAFARLRLSGARCPGAYYSSFGLAEPQSIGGYRTALSPDEPVVVRFTRTPCLPGAPTERDQHRAGRAELLATPYETYEAHIRDQLTRVLAPGGFDADRDIAAVIVNRWPHGYAYEYNPLYDPWDAPEAERPHRVGRRRFGRIAIANSDSGAQAYTSCAIDQGHRAVAELLA